MSQIDPSQHTSPLPARLFAAAYTDFDVAPPARVDALAYGVTVAGAIVYRVCMAIFWLTLNIGTLPFGVFVEPLWRPRARFRRLRLANGIPLIGICMPILLLIVGYNNYRLNGFFSAIGPYLLVAVAGAALIAGCVLFNLARRALFGVHAVTTANLRATESERRP